MTPEELLKIDKDTSNQYWECEKRKVLPYMVEACEEAKNSRYE